MREKSIIFWSAIAFLFIAGITAVGPAERSLGSNVRVVYLHGAWVWAALAAFLGAGLLGFLGLILRHEKWQRWSLALGRTGLIFWITYLPISMWAMQTNWNGLFLAEPRFRLAIIFSVTGLLLQAGVALMGKPAWAAFVNILYAAALFITIQNTPNVMHPSSPIFSSDAWRIQIYFIGLLTFTFLFAWLITRLLFRLDTARA